MVVDERILWREVLAGRSERRVSWVMVCTCEVCEKGTGWWCVWISTRIASVTMMATIVGSGGDGAVGE